MKYINLFLFFSLFTYSATGFSLEIAKGEECFRNSAGTELKESLEILKAADEKFDGIITNMEIRKGRKLLIEPANNCEDLIENYKKFASLMSDLMLKKEELENSLRSVSEGEFPLED